jgi:hypothetical protein
MSLKNSLGLIISVSVLFGLNSNSVARNYVLNTSVEITYVYNHIFGNKESETAFDEVM